MHLLLTTFNTQPQLYRKEVLTHPVQLASAHSRAEVQEMLQVPF